MKYSLKIIFFIILLGFYSCSFITRQSVLIDKKSDHWERAGTCQICESFESNKTYDYKYMKSTKEDMTISICPSSYGFCVLFGPPFIPVIPNLVQLFKNHGKNHPFFVDILFGNFKGKIVDLESVKFTFSTKCIEFRADSIVLLSQNKAKKREFVRNGNEKCRQKISDSLYQFKQDITRLRFYFNFPRNKVGKLSIDFSGLQVNNNIVSFSKINYLKRSRFIYDPFVIGY